jgi:hypothetical protein
VASFAVPQKTIDVHSCAILAMDGCPKKAQPQDGLTIRPTTPPLDCRTDCQSVLTTASTLLKVVDKVRLAGLIAYPADFG